MKIFKKKNNKTKTIYYALVQKMEVPENLTDKEIDDFVFKKIAHGTDYMWSDKPDLFDFENYC